MKGCYKMRKATKMVIRITAFLLILSLAACGSSEKNSSTKKIGEVSTASSAVSSSTKIDAGSSSEAEPVSSASEPVKDAYNVGDILQDGDLEIVYVSSGEYASDNQFFQPKEGNKYIFAKMAFKNISDHSSVSVSAYSFKCYADGYATDVFLGGEDTLSSTLSPGRATSGSLYFEVPIDAQEIEIEYETNFITEKKIKFTFEGEKDSGYVLEKVTTPTEGAYKVGDIVESSKLNVTYLRCFEDESDNMFFAPADGYHFLTCEFEFENCSNSDELVSSLSFDCYADGVDCKSAFFRDDTLSAELSAGRKAKGTVTFEVPVEAANVEVEYLSNYWTENRIVFTAKPE